MFPEGGRHGQVTRGIGSAIGKGRIEATKGRISVDRGSKATLPFTIPRRASMTCLPWSLHLRHVPLGARGPITGRQSGDGRVRHF
ncbi:hypothetical protein Gotur_025084 [Gossypium turneri]